MSTESSDQPIALFFPGQGSQEKGMGSDYYAYSPTAQKIFDKADHLASKLNLGYSITRLCFEDPFNELKGLTINTAKVQPALLTVDIAIYEHLLSMGLKPPKYIAGHSAGKLVAAVAAGAMDFETGFEVMVNRGNQMRRSRSTKEGVVGIIDVKGKEIPELDPEEGLLGLVKGAFASLGPRASSFRPSVENSLTQVVFAGLSTQAQPVLERLSEIPHRLLAIYEGAPVSHSPLVHDAQQGFNSFMEGMRGRISGLNFPMIDDRAGGIITSPGELIISFADHLVEPISWRRAVLKAVEEGATVGFEVGPGKVLKGFSTSGTGLVVYTTGTLKEAEVARQNNPDAFFRT